MKAELLQLDNSVMVARVLLAVGLGAALGLEREIDNQPAGFRTHILVCLGAALFGLISVHAFAPFEATRNSTDVQIDITRVASQVVVGVGFLGGGAILKYGASIRGLTTAASMWVAAAVGLAVGLGYYWAAVAVTIAALVSLTAFRPLRAWVRQRFGRRVETVTFRLQPGVEPSAVLAALNDLAGVKVRNLQVDSSGEATEIAVSLKTEAQVPLDRLLGEIAAREDVAEMSYDER